MRNETVILLFIVLAYTAGFVTAFALMNSEHLFIERIDTEHCFSMRSLNPIDPPAPEWYFMYCGKNFENLTDMQKAHYSEYCDCYEWNQNRPFWERL